MITFAIILIWGAIALAFGLMIGKIAAIGGEK